MSVDRETLALVVNVDPEKVKCKYCGYFNVVGRSFTWCEGWNQPTDSEDFCSFWASERKTERIVREEDPDGRGE